MKRLTFDGTKASFYIGCHLMSESGIYGNQNYIHDISWK